MFIFLCWVFYLQSLFLISDGCTAPAVHVQQRPLQRIGIGLGLRGAVDLQDQELKKSHCPHNEMQTLNQSFQMVKQLLTWLICMTSEL